MAATISVGSPDAPSGVERCFPLTCGNNYGVTDYQQVYTSSAFSGPISISQISFLRDLTGTTNSEPATFNIFLSTTPLGVSGLTTPLSANNGPDKQLFGNFSVGSTIPNVLSFTGTPFAYDPSKGNLFMDIVFTSTAQNNVVWADLMYTAPLGLSSRAWNGDSGVWIQTDSLYTTFNDAPSTAPTQANPEPATISLIGLGLAGVMAGTARRRRFSA